jgi:hypothetical protein
VFGLSGARIAAPPIPKKSGSDSRRNCRSRKLCTKRASRLNNTAAAVLMAENKKMSGTKFAPLSLVSPPRVRFGLFVSQLLEMLVRQYSQQWE